MQSIILSLEVETGSVGSKASRNAMSGYHKERTINRRGRPRPRRAGAKIMNLSRSEAMLVVAMIGIKVSADDSVANGGAWTNNQDDVEVKEANLDTVWTLADNGEHGLVMTSRPSTSTEPSMSSVPTNLPSSSMNPTSSEHPTYLSCFDTPDWSDIDGYGCSWYEGKRFVFGETRVHHFLGSIISLVYLPKVLP